MLLRRVRPADGDVRRYVDDCWLPYHEELSRTVAAHELEPDRDRQAVVDAQREALDSQSTRLWVLLDGVDDPTVPLSRAEATVAGFVRTELEAAPQEFDWPDRLKIDDLWVHEPYRGSGVVDDLLARAVRQAREDGCAELVAEPAVDNDRAVAYFEGLGLEVTAYGMRVPLEGVTVESAPDEAPSHRLRRVQVERAAMERFFEACWLPFWRDLGAAVDEEHLSSDLDREALVERFLEEYDVPDRRCWVALDGDEASPMAFEETDATVAGWINAGLEPTDRFLDAPARLFVGNLYAAPEYRGTGLTDRLIERAIQFASEEGCSELSLGVEAANDRALAYYEKLGFEPARQRMTARLDAVEASVDAG